MMLYARLFSAEQHPATDDGFTFYFFQPTFNSLIDFTFYGNAYISLILMDISEAFSLFYFYRGIK